MPLDVDADLAGLDGAKIFAAPDDPADWPRWREQLSRWRDEARARLGYDDRLYRRTDLTWTQSCFVVAQVWLWDELLYDFDRGSFTPERLLADAQERLGGFDGIVLWHAYPVIGIDDRNQLDYYREVPGLRALVDDLHAAGVRVFLDYNPWDTGTRRAGPDAEELAAVVRDLDADGVFLDTLKEGGAELLARLDAVRAGVAVEGESTLPLARLTDHPLSWAQWFADSDRAWGEVVRAATPDAPCPPLAPGPPRRAAVGVVERYRGDGLGGRLLVLGRLERRRCRMAAADGAGAAVACRPAEHRDLDTAGRPGG